MPLSKWGLLLNLILLGFWGNACRVSTLLPLIVWLHVAFTKFIKFSYHKQYRWHLRITPSDDSDVTSYKDLRMKGLKRYAVMHITLMLYRYHKYHCTCKIMMLCFPRLDVKLEQFLVAWHNKDTKNHELQANLSQ